MTWWATLLSLVLPTLVAAGAGLLTWRSLHAQQRAAALKETAQAVQLDIANLEELRSQVDTLWSERNEAREQLLEALVEIARLRRELAQAEERIVLLEREVLRLGGNPDALNGRNR